MLPANAAKQNRFASVWLSISSSITLGIRAKGISGIGGSCWCAVSLTTIGGRRRGDASAWTIVGVLVLRMPHCGCFICPFAVAGLGLRYCVTSCDVRLGHPLRYPRRIALRRVEILGLQRDWFANRMLFAFVCMVCVKNAIWVAMLARALANTGAAGEIMSAT
jgi:hypothetical protein